MAVQRGLRRGCGDLPSLYPGERLHSGRAGRDLGSPGNSSVIEALSFTCRGHPAA